MKENKTKKGHENIIGKIIYGFLLFMPLLAIGSTLLINTFNNQAKQESEIHYKYKTNEVNSNADIINGNIYLVNLNNFDNDYDIDNLITDENYGTITLTWLNNPGSELTISNYNSVLDDTAMPLYENSLFFNGNLINRYFYYGWFDNSIEAYFEEVNIYYTQNGINYYNVPFVVQISDPEYINSDFYKYIKPVTDLNLIPINHVETHNVDAKDLFYDSIAKVEQSEYFNWATNTTIYTGIATTTTLLGITTTFVPFILTYWLLITVAYLIYDIALMLLLITHRKIHEIQESI